MDVQNLPSTYPDPVPLAIIGGTGLGALPSPTFTPVASIPPLQTPWGLPSSPITILSYKSPVTSTTTTIAFLARHGLTHSIAPHEINNRANVAALKKLGVKAVVGFSAVGSLREEVKPRDFVVAGNVVDWTKGVRPWTFFEDGVVGHISMADPFDKVLSEVVYNAIRKPGLLDGEGLVVHQDKTVICIEGPQFSSRAESLFYRSFTPETPISCINMSAVPECKLFREAEIAYALVCMSTDYDSWHATNEGVSVEMVMSHMIANSQNAKKAVSAILEAVAASSANVSSQQTLPISQSWHNASRGGIMGISHPKDDRSTAAAERLRWLFGDEWVKAGS